MSKIRRADTPTHTEAANLARLIRCYGGLDGSEGVGDAVDTINAMTISDAQQTLESALGIIVGQIGIDGEDLDDWTTRFMAAIAHEPQDP